MRRMRLTLSAGRTPSCPSVGTWVSVHGWGRDLGFSGKHSDISESGEHPTHALSFMFGVSQRFLLSTPPAETSGFTYAVT